MDGATTSARLRLEEELEAVQRELGDIKKRKNDLQRREKELMLQIVENNDEASANRASVDWESEEFEWSLEMRAKLTDVFKIDDFRHHQVSAINLVMAKHDVLLILSTGGGKSLCYQLPAVVGNGIVIVVQPLLSLIEDQLIQLRKLGIDARSLNSTTPKEEAVQTNIDLVNPNSTLRLLYVTPEKLAKSKRFMTKLEKCADLGHLKLIAVDECHCCSQWGHDFRPDYKFLSILKRQFPNVPLLGLTATATYSVLDDVKNILNLQNCEVLRAGFNRKNLFYEVRRKSDQAEAVAADIAGLLNGQFAGQTGIIYCLSKKDCEDLTTALRSTGVQCAFYHADLSPQERSIIHGRWLDGKEQAIIATLAFGMGIDKPDVRFVIHHSIAKAMESYIQESGRAGRDGEVAHCILFYRLADVFRQSTMAPAESNDTLYAMMAYCTQGFVCRRENIAQHFGEIWEPSWCEAMCDVCARPGTIEIVDHDVSTYFEHICTIISTAAAAKKRITAKALIDELAKKCGAVSRSFCEQLVAHFLRAKRLTEEYKFTPYTVISYIAIGGGMPPTFGLTLPIDAQTLAAAYEKKARGGGAARARASNASTASTSFADSAPPPKSRRSK